MLPGETYGEDDVPLFEKVAAAIDGHLPTGPVARRIAAELREARGRSDPAETILLRIVDDIPGLRFLLPALYRKTMAPTHRAQLQRALGMVLTLANHAGAEVCRRDEGAAC